MHLEGLKILLIDDEDDIREFLEYVLKKEGAELMSAENGERGLHLAKDFIPDIILLDKMMPVMDGVTACRELRKVEQLKDSKIVILSAVSDTESQVEGLDIGADDYLVKPIKSELLISKLRALLRNKNAPNKKAIISYKHITIDRTQFYVRVNEDKIVLPKKEFELLSLLISKPGEVFRREEILETVWGKDVYIGDRTIDVHIRKLRGKIGEKYFKTVKGVGYNFVAF